MYLHILYRLALTIMVLNEGGGGGESGRREKGFELSAHRLPYFYSQLPSPLPPLCSISFAKRYAML